MRRTGRVLCVLAAALILGPSDASPNARQSVENLKKLSYEDLFALEVTTVSRTESTVGESPAAVTVIRQEDIRRSGATTIQELLRLVPGLNVARIDNNKWAISARGFNQRFFAKMLVQIDGRTLYNPFTSGVYWDAVDYPLEDIDRIEVIRGPRAGVWGANAVNGIVNIITKSARDTRGGLLVAGAGAQERGFGTFRYGGGSGQLFHRVYAKGFNRGPEYARGAGAHDAWSGGSAGLRIDWQRTRADLITIQGEYLHSAAGRRDLRAQPSPPYSFENADTERTGEANVLGRWTHRMAAGGSWALQAYADAFDRFSDNLRIRFRWYTSDVDFQHQFRLGRRQSVAWGGGYRVVQSTLGRSGRDDGFLFDAVEPRHTNQTLSAYAQDDIRLVGTALTLSLNARLEHNPFTGYETQPGAALLFVPRARHTLWASVARAVRTPNLNEFYAEPRLLPSPGPAPTFPRQLPSPGIRSESVLASQFGYRTQLTQALSVDATVFHNAYDNLVTVRPGTPRPGPSGFDLPITQINGLGARTHGAEVLAVAHPLKRWRLSGAYALLAMDLHRRAALPPSSEAAEGQSPRHQAALQSAVDLAPRLELDIAGRTVSRLTGFNPNGVPGVDNTIPAYRALDARLAWRARPELELSLAGQNLFDGRHAEFGTSPLVRSPLVEIRRSVYAKAAWRF